MDAPRGSVEFEGTDELQRLRRRAYGPNADIAGDAVAQARLSELEAAQRRELTPVVDAPAPVPALVAKRVPVAESAEAPRSASPSVPQPVDGAFAELGPAGGSVTGQVPTEGPIADSDSIIGPPAVPWWRRWLAVLGVAVAALVLIAAGGWMSQLLADESTPIPTETATAEMPQFPAAQAGPDYVPRPDYTLGLKSVGEDPDMPNDASGTLDALGISADELKRYEDFQGTNVRSLTVWSGESRFGMTCLFAAVSGKWFAAYGFSSEGCSLKGKDTIMDVDMEIDGHTRFVLRGDQVNVYVYEGVADPYASQG